ncbi:MAG: hypothetical protein SFU98_14595 [Leptospiraceae bacterium]|nr:hypothetical protein [Leptospiraceae bacterium]
MIFFRVLLILITIGIFTITGIVGSNHGWNFVPIFFGDIIKLNWAGQFNFDFMCFLTLASLWVCWRNQFSAMGIFLAIVTAIFGISFIAPYLLIQTFTCNGDLGLVLLGKNSEK